MLSTEDKIYAKIRQLGRGTVITNSDFYHIAPRGTISRCISNLKNRNIIRQLLVGIYDYPIFDSFLQETLAPDMDFVAQAIARKNQWHIQITGTTALNYLALSTQVPGRFSYLSDAQSANYTILHRTLEFKQASLKMSKFKSRRTEIVVQALLSLGQANVTQECITKISEYILKKETKKILNDSRYAPAWIGDLMRKIITISDKA